ncbi:MAG: hypothetical protein K1X66_06355 [Verrucomicrobiae bacterium]|nr:hypothetical protein [Verrucomicrobiae bacterium]
MATLKGRTRPRKKLKAKTRRKSVKDRSFSYFALLLLLVVVGGVGALYYRQSTQEQEPAETKLDHLILDNPDAEVLELESSEKKTVPTNEDESVPEVFRMGE